jgi:hypothetical protein
MAYDLAAARNKLKGTVSGRRSDPDEFRPDKVGSGQTMTWRFFILPPLLVGDQLAKGKVDHAMDTFCIPEGTHWINKQPFGCPRIWDGSHCPFCQFGFDLYKQTPKSDKVARAAIGSDWMPSTYFLTNIYFPRIKKNPENLQGQVRYYRAPQTCLNIWQQAMERDGPGNGDDDDKEAFGIFYDENAAFLFNLEAILNGQQNGYKSSKFLGNRGVPTPIAIKDGAADPAGIQDILNRRINLWEKVIVPDPEKLQKMFDSIQDGDDRDERDESATATTRTTAATPTTTQPKRNTSAVAAEKSATAPYQPAATVVETAADAGEDGTSGDENPGTSGQSSNMKALLEQLDDQDE